MQTINSITENTIFSGLSSEDRDELGKISQTRDYSQGEIIFLEGEDASGFFLIKTGQVKIYKTSLDGKEQILHILGPGEPFAEVAVFSGFAYPATAQALKKCSTIFFPGQSFKDLMAKRPSLALNMLATLSMRLRQFAHMIEVLSLKEVPGRLAAYLLLESEKNNSEDEISLPITKSLLASFLGTIPETLSRIFKKMAKQGFISIDGSKISLLDRDGLEDLAEGEQRLN